MHVKNIRKLVIKEFFFFFSCGSELEACPEYEEAVAQNGILTLTRLNGCSVLTSKKGKIKKKVSSLWLVGMIFQVLTRRAVKMVRRLILVQPNHRFGCKDNVQCLEGSRAHGQQCQINGVWHLCHSSFYTTPSARILPHLNMEGDEMRLGL